MSVIKVIIKSSNDKMWICKNCFDQLKSHGEIKKKLDKMNVGYCAICGNNTESFNFLLA